MTSILSNSQSRTTAPKLVLLCGTLIVAACAQNPDRRTLADLHAQTPDLEEAEIDDGIDQAMAGYRAFLEEAPKSALTPEAMRRLADLKLEKQFGVLGGPASPQTMPNALSAPERSPRIAGSTADTMAPSSPDMDAGTEESDLDFERRAAGGSTDYLAGVAPLELPDGGTATTTGPRDAIKLYDEILEAYPHYAHNDQVLYQKARAYDELGLVDDAIEVAALMVERYPNSRHLDEIQFRRAEYFFTRKKFFDAEDAYTAIVKKGPVSDYYELALYKLGWTLYKQMYLEEAIESYVELLDYKVTSGYDFDQTEDDANEQRIADTYRVMSLCFSELGGAPAITSFFSQKGSRSYENRVYRNLGEFYLEKLRYNDAATVYQAFVDLYPIHRASPHFSMRIVEIYEAGDFPKLVLESKKSFAARYGLESEYWKHFEVADSPEVLAYLKNNLKDLANHYHALYQNTERPEEKPEHFSESTHWYRSYLKSFPEEPETPSIHYQLADLFLENEDYSTSAEEYELIAYEYPEHERSSAAGYAAIFAHREHEKQAEESLQEEIQRRVVGSTLRFVDRFPKHEHAAAVLGAAIDDLYSLKDYAKSIEIGHRLIAAYPESEPSVLRAAWTVVAHASFDTEIFENAEKAYTQVLELTPSGDPTAVGITNNLAASIYKQGERANVAEDYKGASDHFLRIAKAAPQSEIRPIAEYDAGAALMRLEDWSAAAVVLESLRTGFPDHELSRDATRQLAFVYREDDNLARAAGEYERVAEEATEPELRGEALLVAGDLYTEAKVYDQALKTYQSFVSEFTNPIEPAVVTRFKMANLFHRMGDDDQRLAQLREIVVADQHAGDQRTDIVRGHGARAALTLSERHFTEFEFVQLNLPFEKSLQKKQALMDVAIAAFNDLVDYEVGEVTAAATFYIAEVYNEFSRALIESERPSDLSNDEFDDYEMVLEEEAYPFEEKAIDVHKKNIELMNAGVFNPWIEKSIARLAVIMPGRYAKFEISSGLIQSAQAYTYEPPSAPAAPPVLDQPESQIAEEIEAVPEDQFTETSGESSPPAAPMNSGADFGEEEEP